jgi:hypothetical protein
LTWKSIKIIINCVPKELAVGYRLMVGRQILILDVEVRVLVPEPIPRAIAVYSHYKDSLPPLQRAAEPIRQI